MSLIRALTLEGGLEGAVSLKTLGLSVSGGWTVKAFGHSLAEFCTSKTHDQDATRLAAEAYNIDPDFEDPLSYLYETDFHRRLPGSAIR